MFKKITLSIIGLTLGIGLFGFAPATHAAATVSTTNLDSQTETILVKTLDVLQIVLDEIQSRVNSQTNPIENKPAVSAVLAGIKDTLASISYAISVPGGKGLSFQGVGSDALSEPQAANSGAASDVAGKQPATLSWFVGPKVLLILIPVFVLIIVALVFFRPKREDLIVEKNEGMPSGAAPVQT